MVVVAFALCGSWFTAGADEAPSQGRALHGAGATFPAPVYVRWAAQYKQDRGVDVVYDAIGSGAGLDMIERRLADFGATDIPLSAEEQQRSGLMQFPVIVGGVVPVFNVTGIEPGALRLTGKVLSGIYLGSIRKWNDKAIADLNPSLRLPSSNITVVHRADSSGTTFLWSTFLSTSDAEWRATIGVGSLLDWPTGVAEIGNEGVASAVQRTRASLGYVEYAYAVAHNLKCAALLNRAGVFAQAGSESFEAAASSAEWNEPADLAQSLVDRPGAKSWPIVGASFILIPTTSARDERNVAVKRFFEWALDHGGSIGTALHYSPLPFSAMKMVHRLLAGPAEEQLKADRSTTDPTGGRVNQP